MTKMESEERFSQKVCIRGRVNKKTPDDSRQALKTCNGIITF